MKILVLVCFVGIIKAMKQSNIAIQNSQSKSDKDLMRRKVKYNQSLAHSHLMMNKYDALLVLSKSGNQASFSLCQGLKMIKCGRTCCQPDQFNHQKNRFNCSPQHQGSISNGRESNKFNPAREQERVCLRTGKVYCGGKCCSYQKCDTQHKKQNEIYHLRWTKQVCLLKQTSLQEECKKFGLLWCEGECCGFLASSHKCFSMNHYGTPFIRCPIQAFQT